MQGELVSQDRSQPKFRIKYTYLYLSYKYIYFSPYVSSMTNVEYRAVRRVRKRVKFKHYSSDQTRRGILAKPAIDPSSSATRRDEGITKISGELCVQTKVITYWNIKKKINKVSVLKFAFCVIVFSSVWKTPDESGILEETEKTTKSRVCIV